MNAQVRPFGGLIEPDDPGGGCSSCSDLLERQGVVHTCRADRPHSIGAISELKRDSAGHADTEADADVADRIRGRDGDEFAGVLRGVHNVLSKADGDNSHDFLLFHGLALLLLQLQVNLYIGVLQCETVGPQ